MSDQPTREDPGTVHQWVTARWPSIDWTGAEIRTGAFHTMVLSAGGGPVARTGFGPDHAARTRRERLLVDYWSGLPLRLAVPTVLDGPVIEESASAVLLSRVPGTHRPDHGWDDHLAATYRSILEELARHGPEDAGGLPPPRTWCGGSRWPDLVTTVTRSLPRPLRQLAGRLTDTVIIAESDAPDRLVHGDFGPHNLLWTGRTATSVIDVDHSAVGDPAIDLAPLVGLYGAAAVATITDPATLDRAMVHRATLSLQVASAAHLIGHHALADHAVSTFVRRAGDGTLHDPGGRRPTDPVG